PAILREYVAGIAIAAGDNEWRDRRKAAEDAAIAFRNGGRAYGFPEMEKVFKRDIIKQISDWIDYKSTPAAAATVSTGGAVFELGRGGVPLANCANARIAISALGIECRHDRFHDKLFIGGHAIAQHTGELSDHACQMLRVAIHKTWKFEPSRTDIFDAGVQLCLQNAFDPVVDYLDGLRWDGTKRIDKWMMTYLGAENTKFNRAVGRLALVAMVRRARHPGCKFDQIIVLEGPEGKLKSTALTVLAGAAENFSDQTILGLGDQQQQERLRGVWVYEIGDLSGIRKAEVEATKAFASRT